MTQESKLKLKELISVAFKGAQIETNSKVKLSKNMWLQTSEWHIPNS